MLEILKYPDSKLKNHSKPVEHFDKKLHHLLDEMAKAMYGARGVGLAAPQVAHFLRLFVIDISSQDENYKKLFEIINPKITKTSGKIVYEEGCLSLPGITESVERKSNLNLEYQDRHGGFHSLEAEGLLAVAIQHENDHLDGKLFIDRLSPLKRKLLRKKIEKAVVL